MNTKNSVCIADGIFCTKKEAPKGLDSRVDRYDQGTALPTMDASNGSIYNTDTVCQEKEAFPQVNPQLHEWLGIVNENASGDEL